MSTTTKTGLFYAYAKDVDFRGANSIITFTTRDVADTWYRLVTDAASNDQPYLKSISRVSLQFFTYSSNEASIESTIINPAVAQLLKGKMIFTSFNNENWINHSVIPVLNYTEYTNGGRFFIRSSSQDNTYWYYDHSSRHILASQTHRTPFTITIADQRRALGITMIGTDKVYLTLKMGDNIGVANSQGQLGTSVNPFPLEFSSFGGDYEVDYDAFAGVAAGSHLGAVSYNPGKGERWELV